MLKEKDLSDNKQFIIQLRRCEKLILQKAVKFAADKKCNIGQNKPKEPTSQVESKVTKDNVGT